MRWRVQRLVDKGYVFIEKENYQRAVDCLEKAVEIDPYTPELYAYLGEAYFHNQEYQKAMDAFTKRDQLILAADPLTSYIEGYRGSIAFYHGDHILAENLIDQAIEKGVKDPEVLYNQAALQIKKGNIGQACKIFKQIDSLEPYYNYKKIQRLIKELTSFSQEKVQSDIQQNSEELLSNE